VTTAIMSVSGVPRQAADQLLGPDHGSTLDPAIMERLSDALQGGLHTVFWFVVSLAAGAFLLGLLFPRVEQAVEHTPTPIDD
jgi:hypothetical protein